MPDPAPQPELLRSLGHLMRGLSVLFWGLPVALVVCVQTSQADYLRMFGVLPPVLVTAVLVYGLWLMGRFRPEESIWMSALERASVLALVNLGLSPFLFFWNRMPASAFFTIASQIMAGTGLMFLLALNPVLRRLTAMLPDEALRHETRVFTRMNTVLVALNLVATSSHFLWQHFRPAPVSAGWLLLVERAGQWGGWFLVLLSVALTMALLWKTKEAIFHSVFGGPSWPG